MLLVAESQGFLPPERARALEEQVARTQADLERLRRDNPDWAAEVDAAIGAFNDSDLAASRDAFARIDALIEDRRGALLAEAAELRLQAARSKHAQATLFYFFDARKSAKMLQEAAMLAKTEPQYWIDCGRANVEAGNLKQAMDAFVRGRDLAQAAGKLWEVASALMGSAMCIACATSLTKLWRRIANPSKFLRISPRRMWGGLVRSPLL